LQTYGCYDDSSLRWVVRDSPWVRVLISELPDTNDRRIRIRTIKIMRSDVFIPDVEQSISMDRESRSFPVQLEDDQAGIVARCEQV